MIGRNEGQRLPVCLRSTMRAGAEALVYVDSGSEDGSRELAASMGCDVLELDRSQAFSAARARNEGFVRLLKRVPNLSYVQFIDGDCELADGWLERGIAELDTRLDFTVVCGRVRERHPDASIYNRAVAAEWIVDTGVIKSCGGNFMVRTETFHAVEGFRADVIAAEDDEFCLRIRRLGGTIVCVNANMAIHDHGATNFVSWWRRARRSGHAYAQGAALHGRSADRHFVRDCQRIWLWGLCIPVAAFALAWPTSGLSLALLVAYPIQVTRIYRERRRRGWTAGDALTYSGFTMLSKFPALLGLLQYHWRSWRGQAFTIIEHKRADRRFGFLRSRSPKS